MDRFEELRDMERILAGFPTVTRISVGSEAWCHCVVDALSRDQNVLPNLKTLALSSYVNMEDLEAVLVKRRQKHPIDHLILGNGFADVDLWFISALVGIGVWSGIGEGYDAVEAEED
jgi:hypothetical protein